MPKLKLYNIRDAIFEAMLHRFAIDPTMIAFGEENRDWGGAFARLPRPHRSASLSPPVQRSHLRGRDRRAPPSGYAMEGGRVVAELMYADFIGPRRRRDLQPAVEMAGHVGRQLSMPVVLRISVGAKYGAQHSAGLDALWCTTFRDSRWSTR